MKKKLLAVILAISFITLATIPSLSIAAYKEPTIMGEKNATNNYTKIHIYFSEEEHTYIDNSEELLSALKLLQDYSSSGLAQGTNLNVTIEFKGNFTQTQEYLMLANEREKIDNSQDLLKFRQKLNAYSEEYHFEIIEKNKDSLSCIPYSSIQPIKYTTSVLLTVIPEKLTSKQLEELIILDSINNISISYPPYVENETSWSETLDCIGSYEIVEYFQNINSSVRIGIYESGGVCNTSHPNLAGKDITIRDASSPITNHANAVVSILTLMIPNAKFFVSETTNHIQGIAWFIDNYCDIVNCSFGYSFNILNSDGTYTEGTFGYRYDIDGIYDYQIQTHFITVCKSAGNKITDNTMSAYNPNSKITSPGYGYNVITVGGIQKKYLNSSYHWVHAENSCYDSHTPSVKPNISAPYHVTIPNYGAASGTSFSAPLVTGSIAILMSSAPGYTSYPERILSVLTSTAKKTYDYLPSSGAFDNEVGAGIINLYNAVRNDAFFLNSNDNTIQKTEVRSLEIELNTNDELQIALSWLVITNIYSEVSFNTDYQLYLYDPAGILIVSSGLWRSNVEMIRHTVATPGTYRIVVFQRTARDPNIGFDYLCLSYNIY